ncbi:MAG: DnaA N-terminal domain-containing protein, partial [Thermoanaerobaculia bacterium]
MSLTPAEVWKRLLDLARQDIPEQTFRTWLEPTEALAIDGNIISIGVPDQFAADWNESKHADLFAGYAPIALGHPMKVVFRVQEERKKRSQMDFFVAPPPSSIATERAQNAASRLQLSSRYTFDHFVIGKSNELAAAAAHAVAQAPGKVY